MIHIRFKEGWAIVNSYLEAYDWRVATGHRWRCWSSTSGASKFWQTYFRIIDEKCSGGQIQMLCYLCLNVYVDNTHKNFIWVLTLFLLSKRVWGGQSSVIFSSCAPIESSCCFNLCFLLAFSGCFIQHHKQCKNRNPNYSNIHFTRKSSKIVVRCQIWKIFLQTSHQKFCSCVLFSLKDFSYRDNHIQTG